MIDDRPRILVLADHYLPGWRAGGPIRSMSNMVSELGDRCDFWIVTQDRDHLDDGAYPGIEVGNWTEVGKANVLYVDRSRFKTTDLATAVSSVAPDLVFANSLFSDLTLRLLWIRRTRRIGSIPVLIAPRGELSTGALALKARRKLAYLKLGRLVGLFSGVFWQASSVDEVEQIARKVHSAEAAVAADIPTPPNPAPLIAPTKHAGSVRLVFTARISPMKNLPFLLRLLPQVEGTIKVDLFGPKEDAEYAIVEEVINDLPKRITVGWHGPVAPGEIQGVVGRSHFSVLPTRGENFGHSIYEALRIGRPVVISDQTPWHGLDEAGAGWVVPLQSSDAWVRAIQRCVDIEDSQYQALAVGAHRFAQEWYLRVDPSGQQWSSFGVVLDSADS
jgi:glycosyltransferase involved in cell wall biosynthesis